MYHIDENKIKTYLWTVIILYYYISMKMTSYLWRILLRRTKKLYLYCQLFTNEFGNVGTGFNFNIKTLDIRSLRLCNSIIRIWKNICRKLKHCSLLALRTKTITYRSTFLNILTVRVALLKPSLLNSHGHHDKYEFANIIRKQ